MNEPHALTTWDELFAQHERFVFRLAYDLVHDRHLAEDLVQQTWLTAIERPPTARRSLKGWLATVLRNLAIDHFRTDRRPKAQAHDDLAHAGEPSFADDEETAQIRQRVLDSLHELDPIYRDVLRLHYIEGQTLAAVAESLSLPLETARTRCRRGLSRLRLRLDRRYRGRRPWVAALAPFALRAPEAWLAPGVPGASAAQAPSARAPSGSSRPSGASDAFVARWLPALAVLVPSIALVVLVLTRGDARPTLAGVEQAQADVAAREVAPLVGAQEPSARVALLAASPPADVALAGAGPTKVRVRHAATGEPLAGVSVLLQTESAEVHRESPVLVSDAAGWIALDGLEPGRWTVRPERGKAILVDLPRRDTGELELQVPDGIEVSGRVVDTTGAAVPFATVHVTWPSWIRAREVATCDAEGAFRVPKLDRSSLIVAADDLGYGWLFGFDNPVAAGRTSIQVELLVPEPGRVVEGVVVDPAGRPVAGASVRGMARLRTTAEQPDPALLGDLGAMPPPAEVTTTDDSGRFRLGHFRSDVDALPINAWAEGFARAAAVATDGMVEIRLEHEAVVEGTVLAPDGAPAAWARVSAGVPGQPQPSIVRADAQGRFRMDRLPQGRLRFEALSDRHGSEGWIEGEVELRAGLTTRWDARLGEKAQVRGSALDAAGRPLVGWVVQLVVEDEIESHRATGRFNDNRLIRSTLTDGAGRFAFYGCRPQAHLVKAYAPDDQAGYPRAWQWGVVPDAAELVLRDDESSAARSRLRGRLVLPDGGAQPSLHLLLYSRLIGRALTIEVARDSGAFDVGPLPADVYQMSVMTPTGFVSCPPVELGPGDIVDLYEVLVAPDAEATPLSAETARSHR